MLKNLLTERIFTNFTMTSNKFSIHVSQNSTAKHTNCSGIFDHRHLIKFSAERGKILKIWRIFAVVMTEISDFLDKTANTHRSCSEK